MCGRICTSSEGLWAGIQKVSINIFRPVQRDRGGAKYKEINNYQYSFSAFNLNAVLIKVCMVYIFTVYITLPQLELFATRVNTSQ